jgi:hypothetical protein
MIPAEPSVPPGGIASVNITRAAVAFTLAESHDGLSCEGPTASALGGLAAIALANASKGAIAFPVTAIRSGLRGDNREEPGWLV